MSTMLTRQSSSRQESSNGEQGEAENGIELSRSEFYADEEAAAAAEDGYISGVSEGGSEAEVGGGVGGDSPINSTNPHHPFDSNSSSSNAPPHTSTHVDHRRQESSSRWCGKPNIVCMLATALLAGGVGFMFVIIHGKNVMIEELRNELMTKNNLLATFPRGSKQSKQGLEKNMKGKENMKGKAKKKDESCACLPTSSVSSRQDRSLPTWTWMFACNLNSCLLFSLHCICIEFESAVNQFESIGVNSAIRIS